MLVFIEIFYIQVISSHSLLKKQFIAEYITVDMSNVTEGREISTERFASETMDLPGNFLSGSECI